MTSSPPETNIPATTPRSTLSEATLVREVIKVMTLLVGAILLALLLGGSSAKILIGYAGIPICIRYLLYRFKHEKSDTPHEQAISRRLPSICVLGALIAILSEAEALPFVVLTILLLIIGVWHFGKNGERIRMSLILAIQWFITYLLIVIPSTLLS